MTTTHSIFRSLALPAIVSPMFLVSGPDLVIAACRGGLLGTFPALNQRSTEGYRDWLRQIVHSLGDLSLPFGVNLIVHKTNRRLDADLQVTVEEKVPIVITSLGAVKSVVDAIHSYGGLVFHDVIDMRFAEKALAAGVDGLVAVCAGAGGHAGRMNPLSFIEDIRSIFAGPVALAGAISTGRQVLAAQAIGADFAYMGTRFIATRESLAPQAYKEMIVASVASDIIYTPAISGVNANFLRPSIVAAGRDPDDLTAPTFDFEHEAKAWRDVWSAGHGVGAIRDIPTTADLCARLREEYEAARRALFRGREHALQA